MWRPSSECCGLVLPHTVGRGWLRSRTRFHCGDCRSCGALVSIPAVDGASAGLISDAFGVGGTLYGGAGGLIDAIDALKDTGGC